MRLDLSKPYPTNCAKAGCFNFARDRHHMGSEAMWLRHFKTKSRTKRYREFKARYLAFLPEDICPLCGPCHEDITGLNWELIGAFMRTQKAPACKTWTWEQAEELMQLLRVKFLEWLKVPRSMYPIKGILIVVKSPRFA